ncbi:MAG TPA: glycosyltransferase family 39 protein, partial [Tepidisphaeraceae bacterium]|nr:glycosyltransferase family 39 protein [Tepidisphaeraceae bacterium]
MTEASGIESDKVVRRNRSGIIFASIMLALVIAVVFGSRIFGPSDLYVKDQGKTIAYTGDMVLNGRLALPRDVIFQPATKPPLYNWLSAAGVKLTGSFSEFMLKWPSVAAALFGGWVVYFLCRRLLDSSVDRSVSIITGLL